MNNYLLKKFGLKGKKSIVTGASRGIGRAIAEAFSYAGSEIFIHYYKSGQEAIALKKLLEKSGGQAHTVKADVTNPDDVIRMFEVVSSCWENVDILVNNVGDLVQKSVTTAMSNELIDATIRVNLNSMIYCTREVIPLMKNSNNPCIVNLGSVAAHNGGSNGSTLYAATKAAVHTFTRGLAKELAPKIRVNGIAPGTILTNFHRKYSTKTQLEKTIKNTPLKRLGNPEDIAAAAVYLCGEGASFVTGEIMEINGGFWLA